MKSQSLRYMLPSSSAWLDHVEAFELRPRVEDLSLARERLMVSWLLFHCGNMSHRYVPGREITLDSTQTCVI